MPNATRLSAIDLEQRAVEVFQRGSLGSRQTFSQEDLLAVLHVLRIAAISNFGWYDSQCLFRAIFYDDLWSYATPEGKDDALKLLNAVIGLAETQLKVAAHFHRIRRQEEAGQMSWLSLVTLARYYIGAHLLTDFGIADLSHAKAGLIETWQWLIFGQDPE